MRLLIPISLVLSLSACGGLTGPPDEVSRDYAETLLTEQPRAPGTAIFISKDMVQCLKADGYVSNRVQWNLTDLGNQYFADIEMSFFTEFGKIVPKAPISLSGVNVTGVRSSSPTRAIIEYTASHSYGELDQQTQCFAPNDDRQHSVVAEKYDDGWRLQ